MHLHNGYTVVREIGGHGVGLEFHEEPWVGYNIQTWTGDADGSGHDFYDRADGEHGTARISMS